MEHISSRQNPLVRRVRALSQARGDDGELLLDGPHLLDEAHRSGVVITLALFASDAVPGRFDELAAAAGAKGARVATVPPGLLASLSPVRQPSGVVAIARRPRRSIEDVLAVEPALLVVLDTVQDPGNVGAIVRAAEACGATGVIAGPGTADPFGPRALRGSMGSTFRLPVATTSSLDDVLEHLRQRGIRVMATVPRGGTPLAEAKLDGPTAILLGGEGAGLDPTLAAHADQRLTIEMRPPVESLNVAISAALILYEGSRQRRHVAVR